MPDKNKVVFGLKNVHIAFADEASVTQPAWEPPIKVAGAVRFTATPQGQEVVFNADNIQFFRHTTNTGYDGELEMALIPDNVLAEMLGWEIDDNGALIEVADGTPREFALMYEVDGDKRNRRVVMYKCLASRPTTEQGTRTETIEPKTTVLQYKAIPHEEILVNGKAVSKSVLEYDVANAVPFGAFFDDVYLPEFAVV